MSNDFMEHLAKHFADMFDDEPKFERTVPLRKEWRRALQEYREAQKEVARAEQKKESRRKAFWAEVARAEQKKESRRKAFWAMVEGDLDHYGRMKLINDDTEIGIVGDSDED